MEDWDSFKEGGEEEMIVLSPFLGFTTASSSSWSLKEDVGMTLRFRLFAGGAIPAEAAAVMQHQSVNMQVIIDLTRFPVVIVAAESVLPGDIDRHCRRVSWGVR